MQSNPSPKAYGTKSILFILLICSMMIGLQLSADISKGKSEGDKGDALGSQVHAAKHWSPSTGFADLIETVSPAVVHVAIKGDVSSRGQSIPRFNFPPGFEDFFEPFGRPQAPNKQNQPKKKRIRPLGIGSGFIISADGYVVTNHHVIKNADEIIVTLTDGTEYEAQLKGSDNKTDLALLKLKGAKKLPYVRFGDDEKSRVGDWVLAIGNPFGLGGSASTGIISARGRDINSGPYDNYIQVDAAINRGNSGGPLFNMEGDVIGVNTAIYSPNGGSVGVGFSIPASMAKTVIAQLKDRGSVERGWIGVQIQPLNDELAEGFGRDNEEGALIASVVENKPADKAGLKAGDIILSFNGERIKEMRDLPRIVAQSKVGKTSKMVVWRNGAKKTLSIKVAAYPSDDDLIALSRGGVDSNQNSEQSSALGLTVIALNTKVREQYNIEDASHGVLVVEVEADGLAAQNGIRQGDIITSFNRKSIKSPEQLKGVVDSAKANNKKTVPVLLRRDNNNRFLPFSLVEE